MKNRGVLLQRPPWRITGMEDNFYDCSVETISIGNTGEFQRA